MLRKPVFWIVFVVVAALCLYFAVRNFSTAFPLVTLDLSMDREAALTQAQSLAEENGWGPEHPRSAATFSLNSAVQSFVELEGGGNPAFSEMLSAGLYSPYTWAVRLFEENEVNETLVRFTPDGKFFSFRERLPEDQPGAALEEEAARLVAEQGAASWQVDLGEFELVESSQEAQPGDRVDHTFVYERPGLRISEEGRYRLRLVVSGDEFTELTHFIKIPEAFTRRYEEMRSANDGIATGAAFAMAILYLAGGCVGGLFLLLRKRWVLWKHAVLWAGFIGFLQLLVALNQMPLSWMGYDTAVSSTTFVAQQIGLALLQGVGMGLLLAVSFMAAESLTRRAFPEHIQLWKTWSFKVAATPGVLGRTIAGYLLIAVFFAYEVALYFLASEHLGWWSPSDALFDPNVLATVFPWLTSIAISLQAGFWEECLFRAVPLACAALLGKKYGKTWLWITAAMVLQAVIFGGGHANYPAQPAWARLAELIIPALGFGALYLLWGLLPAIVLHFAFDVVWFALPLFAATSPGIWVDRSLVILLTLVPIWVILFAVFRNRGLRALDEDDLNKAWKPDDAEPAKTDSVTIQASPGLGQKTRFALLGAGLVGVVVWIFTAQFSSDIPKLTASASQAREAAQQELETRGIVLEKPWRELTTVQAPVGADDRFIWQEGGPEVYTELLGPYLTPPRWYIRYARFEGDVAERAEEYAVIVGPDGSVIRSVHMLPEGREGRQLEEDAARALAHEAIQTAYGVNAAKLREVSAEPAQLEARRDWSFVFADDSGYPLDEGEARTGVEIGGDEVLQTYRFIHVPEEWEREDRRRSSIVGMVSMACGALMVLVFVTGGVLAVIRWSRHRFAAKTFGWVLLLMATLGLINLINVWPTLTSVFQTAQPFKLQAGILLVGGTIGMLVLASIAGLLIGLVHRWIPQQPSESTNQSLLAAVGLGALLTGIAAASSQLAPALAPTWPSFDDAGTMVPVLASMLGPLNGWILSTGFALFVLSAVNNLSATWSRRRGLAIAIFFVFGLVLAGTDAQTLWMWLVGGLGQGAVITLAYVLVFRNQLALVPMVTAAMTALGSIRVGILGAFPTVLPASIVAAILVLGLGFLWFRRMTTDSQPPTATEAKS